MPTYEVIAGNVGTVHLGENYDEAYSTYDEYVAMSEQGYGRVGGEQVTLFKDGEPIEEYIPPEVEEIEDPDLVVFFEWKPKHGPGIIAVFPEEVVDDRGNVNSYVHIGQHGAANMDALAEMTSFVGVWPHQSDEVKALWKELEEIGYSLKLHPGFYG